jgi:mRNA guanylyltransferase
LLYLTNGGDKEVTYLIDRKNDYYWVEGLHFPLPADIQAFHTGTLVDGELVNDAQPGGTVQLKYLVFDCMTLDSSSLMHRTLDKRLAYFQDKVFNPCESLLNQYPEERKYLPFFPNLPHGNDGLIFTCRTSPYKFGTDPNILKWKPADENSIDFRLTLDWPLLDPDSEDEQAGVTSPYPDYAAMPAFNLSVVEDERQYVHYGAMHIPPKQWTELKARHEPLDERLAECHQDDAGRWRFMRFRDDKDDANHISTVDSVMESICDRVEERDLIAIAQKVRDAWKRRESEDAAAKDPAGQRRATPGAGNAAANGGGGVAGLKRKLGELEDSQWSEGKRRVTPQP